MDAAIFGLIVADILAHPMTLRPPPKAGGLQTLESLQFFPGGNACNVSVAMAKLGLRVAAAGLVGHDVLGEAIVDKLRDADVDTQFVRATKKAQTSATVVAVESGGERTFFHTPGVTNHLDGSILRSCFPLFAQCRFVQIGYFGLLPPGLTEDLPQVLRDLRAAAPEVKICLDTVNPPASRESLVPILSLLDVFAPSRPEAEALTGETDPEMMIASLRLHMPRGLIGIKLDAEGCRLDDGAKSVVAPACAIDVVDTTGAGDAWFAGLLAALIRKMPLEQSARFANRVAADCCTALGATAGVKSFEETIARCDP